MRVYESSRSKMDELEELQAEARLEQARSELGQVKKMSSGMADIYRMAEIYNSEPSRLADFEVEFLKQNAPKLGIDISVGMHADKKGITAGKIGGLLAGAVDSLLFDLIPDNAYVNRHNRGWANAGKIGATVGSLALGGYGALKALSRAKALSAATAAAKTAKVTTEAGKGIVKNIVSKYSDDLVALFGDDVVRSMGDMSLSDLQKLLKGTNSAATKKLSILAKKYKVTGGQKVVNGKVWSPRHGKWVSVDSKLGQQLSNKKLVSVSKLRRAIEKSWSNAETHSKYVTRKLNEKLAKLYDELDDIRESMFRVRGGSLEHKALQAQADDVLQRIMQTRQNMKPSSQFRRALAEANRQQIAEAADDLIGIDKLMEVKRTSAKIRSAASRQVASWRKGTIPKPSPGIAERLPWWAGAPGSIRSGVSGMIAPATGRGRAKNIAIAVPQVAFSALPAIKAMRPPSYMDMAAGPYGILNPIFAPNSVAEQQAGIANLPFGGMVPMMQGGNQEVNKMMNQ